MQVPEKSKNETDGIPGCSIPMHLAKIVFSMPYSQAYYPHCLTKARNSSSVAMFLLTEMLSIPLLLFQKTVFKNFLLVPLLYRHLLNCAFLHVTLTFPIPPPITLFKGYLKTLTQYKLSYRINISCWLKGRLFPIL